MPRTPARGRRVRLAPVLAALLSSVPPGSASPQPYHEPDGTPRFLAITPGASAEEFREFLDRVDAAGGWVPVAVAGGGACVAGSPELAARLAADPLVARVIDRGATPSGLDRDPAAAALLLWWSGPLDAASPGAGETSAPFPADFCAAGPASERTTSAARAGCPLLPRTHFVQGRSIVNLVFPESVGPASVYDWSESQRATVLAELVRACDWWARLSARTASFVIVDHGLAETPHEPAAAPVFEDGQYLGECLADLGWNGPCWELALDAFNEAMRTRHGGHWSWTQIIRNAEAFPYGSPALAYAILGGPMTVALRGNGGHARHLDVVMAHEMGHIYQALDEYHPACRGCGDPPAGYLNVPNLNCQTCGLATGRCIMRNFGEFTPAEMDAMETGVVACRQTLGMAGLWDSNRDGIADVLTTYPETTIETDFPDTLRTSLGTVFGGRAWDVPYAAPARYAPAVTINFVRDVLYSLDGRAWRPSSPTDGRFASREEEFTSLLPALGGGTHRVRVRAVNSAGFADRTPAEAVFFVHDVRLLDPLEVVAQGDALIVRWRTDGDDFDGPWRLTRAEDGGPPVTVATLASSPDRNAVYTWVDDAVTAGHDYSYAVSVEIAGRGRKSLGAAAATALLPDPPPGSFVTLAPNPARGNVLFTVTVPAGPRPGRNGVELPPAGSGPALALPDDPDSRNPFLTLFRDVRVRVFDLRGREVRDLGLHRERERSRFNVTWHGDDAAGRPLPAGVYFVDVRLDYDRSTVKVVLVD